MEPDWIAALRLECQRTSQNRAAKRLGISAATISLVLNNRYPADTASLEARIRGELLSETVECPVLGEISRRVCCDEQAKPFAATNPIRVALYRACRGGCKNSFLTQGDHQ